MADEGLRIVNTVDNSQVDNAFNRMRKEIVNSAETAQQQGRKIDDAFDKVALSVNATSSTLKRKIYESSQVVNELTAKIIEQKAVVKDVQADVKRLGEAYKQAKANGSYGASGALAEYNAAKKALEEERAALFSLNQEKSKASLKVKELRGQYDLMKKATDDNVLSIGMLKKGLAEIGGTVAIKSFIQSVIQTRGEFQQLEVAFTTMLGSADKAKALMEQLTKTAASTPFDLKGVTDGAKQLLAYGVAADEVNDTLIHLGDIAAGLSIPLGDLVYLYGTTMTQGRMFTQDLRQFMGRGIPLAEELAKQFGVTKDKVGELVTAGKVGATEFKTAIMSLSSEGGKFGGLMEEQSKTITGQISNIEDAIDGAFNKIGTQSEGAINTALDGVSYLVENYEKVGKIILSVAGVYGTYKAAVLAVIAVEKIAALARLAQIKQTTLCQIATDILSKKMAILNATMLANPWVLAATAVAGFIAVLINLETQADRVKNAEEDLDNEHREAIRLEDEHKRKIEELCNIAGNEELSTENRRAALIKLEQQYPAIFKKYDTEAEKLAHILEIKNAIAEADGKKSVKLPSVEYAKNQKEIAALEKKGKATYQSVDNGMYFSYTQTGGRTQQEEARLTALKNRQQALSKQIQKDKGDAYMTNLTGVSNADLAAQIRERQNLLAKMQLTGKKYGQTLRGGVQGVYTADELQGQLQIFQSEQKKRNTPTYTPAQTKARLAKEVASAKAALKAFDNSSTTMSVEDAEKERKKLSDAVSEAEKKYKAMGGTDSSKTAKKQATERAKQIREQNKLAQLEQKQKREQLRSNEDMEIETRQAILDAQKESSDKTLAQVELDFEKQKLALDRGYEDLKQKKIDNARALFEANPKNQGKQFDESSVDTSYTTEEQANYQAELDKLTNQRVKAEEEVFDSQISFMYEYLKQYGNIQEQKLAIASEYDKKIEKEQDEWVKKTLKAEKQAALDQITSENLLKEIDLESVFSEYGEVLTGSLESTIKELQKYTQTSSFKSRSITDQKAIYEAISKAQSQLGGVGGASFSEVGTNLQEYNNALVNYNAISKERADLAQECINAEEALKKANLSLAKAKTDEEKATAQNAVAEAKAKVNTANANYNGQTDAFNNAQNNLVTSQAKATESLQKFQTSIENIGNVAQGLASGSMKQLWNAFGKKTQKRIAEFVTGTHSFNNAVDDLMAKLTEGGTSFDDFSKKISDTITQLVDSGNGLNLDDVTKKVTELFEGITGKDSDATSKLGDKVGKIISESLNKSSEEGDDEADAIKKAGDAAIQAITKESGSLWGLIIGLIFDLLDVLSEGIGGLVETILDKVGAAVEGILTNIGSGKFFEQLATGIGNLVAGVVKGIGNLFTGGLWASSNVEEMEEEIAELATANEALATSIDALTKTIESNDSTNQQSVEAAQKAIAAENEWEANQRKAINDRASEWSNSGHGFLGLGGEHSFNYYAGQLGNDVWSAFTKALQNQGYDKTINGVGDVWNLSPEEMEVIRDFAPAAWAKFINSSGESNPSDLINEYIERSGTLDTLVSTLNEKLTGYSWDGFKDSFVNALEDMTSTTEDFADNIEKLISNAVLNSLITENYQDRIKALYKMIADAASDGEITKKEADAIREENEAIANSLIKDRETLVNLGIIKDSSSYSQEASSKGFQSMSQDTGEELNGRFTAIQIAAYDIKDLETVRNEMLTRMEQGQGNIKSSVDGITDALALTNIHLSDISKYTKHLLAMEETLTEIKDNTKHL